MVNSNMSTFRPNTNKEKFSFTGSGQATAQRVNDISQSTKIETVTGETLTLSAGAAGTTGKVSPTYAPITDSLGRKIAYFNTTTDSDTSVVITHLALAGNEIRFDEYLTETGLYALLSNGDYTIDYTNGVIYYKKGTADTAGTINYKYTSQEIDLSGSSITIGAVDAKGIYNATEPSLSDGDKLQLQLDSKGNLKTAGGASGVSGGGLSLYVLDSDNTMNQGKIVYTSASTCTLSALPFTATANLISKIDRFNNTGLLVETFTPKDTAMTISSNVLTISGMSASATDTFVLYILGSERTTDIGQNAVMTLGLKNVWNQYTSEQTLIEDGALTATYTQIGSDIDVRGFPILQAGVVVVVGTSTDIKLKIVQKLADGSYLPIDGYSDIILTESKSYKFDLPAIETVAFQVKDAAAGTGTVSLYYNQAWR